MSDKVWKEGTVESWTNNIQSLKLVDIRLILLLKQQQGLNCSRLLSLMTIFSTGVEFHLTREGMDSGRFWEMVGLHV